MRLSPVLAGLRTYPFVRLTEAKRAAGRRRRARSSTSASASRARRRRRSSARRWPTRSTPLSTYPRGRRAARAARRRSPAGWRGASASRSTPTREVVPTLGSKEAIFHARAGRRRRRSWSCPHARLPGARARRAVRRQRGLELPLRADRRLPARPRRAAALGRARRAVAELPEQPDGGDRAARRSTRRRRAGPRARLRARLRRGVLRAVVRRRAARLGAPARRPHERRRVQHALQALVDAGLPRRASSPATRSSIAALKRYRPNVGAAPQEFVQRAAVAAWGDEAARRRDARALPRQARRAAAGAGGAGLRHAGGDASFFLWLAGGGRRRSPSGCSSTASSLAPGSFFGAGGEGHVRLALVPTLEECGRAAELLARRAAPR